MLRCLVLITFPRCRCTWNQFNCLFPSLCRRSVSVTWTAVSATGAVIAGTKYWGKQPQSPACIPWTDSHHSQFRQDQWAAFQAIMGRPEPEMLRGVGPLTTPHWSASCQSIIDFTPEHQRPVCFLWALIHIQDSYSLYPVEKLLTLNSFAIATPVWCEQRQASG